MAPPLLAYYRDLRRRYGPQHWWPAKSPFEVMVGAILTQNTAWTNVEKALATLKAHDLLEPRRLLELDPGTLEVAIRSAGFFRLKARRLREFLRWYVEKHGADDDAIRALGTGRAREELLEINGIGPETADSILLYGFGLPTFVVDRYTWRVLTRHGLAPEESTYDEMKELFESNLKRDRALFNEFHALIVRVGKEHCGTKAKCAGCPLEKRLPGK